MGENSYGICARGRILISGGKRRRCRPGGRGNRFDLPAGAAIGAFEVVPAVEVLAIEKQLPTDRLFGVGQGIDQRIGGGFNGSRLGVPLNEGVDLLDLDCAAQVADRPTFGCAPAAGNG